MAEQTAKLSLAERGLARKQRRAEKKRAREEKKIQCKEQKRSRRPRDMTVFAAAAPEAAVEQRVQHLLLQRLRVAASAPSLALGALCARWPALACEQLGIIALDMSHCGRNDAVAVAASQALALTIAASSTCDASHFGGFSRAAFSFALAGVASEPLFEALAAGAGRQLHGAGSRAGAGAVTVAELGTIAADLGAAGLRGNGTDKKLSNNNAIFALAGRELKAKAKQRSRTAIAHGALSPPLTRAEMRLVDELTRNPAEFCLFSAAAASRLWRYSATQTKRKRGQGNCLPPPLQPWDNLFDDTSRPLVVDVGCGFGTSLLGLAAEGQRFRLPSVDGSRGDRCNFLGCDLSAHACNYANGIAERWRLGHKCKFVFADAAECVDHVQKHYPGPILLLLLQFPTPFAASSGNGSNNVRGNLQLPARDSTHFMARKQMLRACANAVTPGGVVFVQSNVEEVAVYMKDVLDAMPGLCVLGSEQDDTRDEDVAEQVPTVRGEIGHNCVAPVLEVSTRRTSEWAASGGKRAVGTQWLTKSILPRNGRTETEVAYEEREGRDMCVYRTAWTKSEILH